MSRRYRDEARWCRVCGMRKLVALVVLAGAVLPGCGVNDPGEAASGSIDAPPLSASAFRKAVCAYPDDPIGSAQERQALGAKALDVGLAQNGVVAPRGDEHLHFLLATLPTLASLPAGQESLGGPTPPSLPNGEPMPQTLEAALDAIRHACT